MVEPIPLETDEIRNLRTVTLSSLNWSVGLQSSFVEDDLNSMLKKAIQTLTELKKQDGCI